MQQVGGEGRGVADMRVLQLDSWITFWTSLFPCREHCCHCLSQYRECCVLSQIKLFLEPFKTTVDESAEQINYPDINTQIT